MARIPRKKVKISYITNTSARNASFKKRKACLLKKMQEITTLCDVKGCAIIYYSHEEEPVLYPNDQSKVSSVIYDFHRLPNDYQTKHMLNQEIFLMDKISKANEQLKRLTTVERERNLERFMHQCLVDKTKSFENLTTCDLNDLYKMLDLQLVYIDRRIQSFEREATKVSSFEQLFVDPTMVSTNKEQNEFFVQENIQGSDPPHLPKYNFDYNLSMDFDPVEYDQWYTEMIKNSPKDGVGSSSGSNSSINPKI